MQRCMCHATQAVTAAPEIAKQYSQQIVETEHLLKALLEQPNGLARKIISKADGNPTALLDATEADWDTEFLALTLAVGIVDSLDEAIEHVNAHGSGHSEAIVSGDAAALRAFELGVDAACLYLNASTRFTDGGEFGMGAEIGNSTQKLHARGPIGMRELCSAKYVVQGDGHVLP